MGEPLDSPLAPVAQWIEQLPSKQSVVGSSPTWGAHNSENSKLETLKALEIQHSRNLTL